MCDLRVCVGYGMRKYERCVTTKLVACVETMCGLRSYRVHPVHTPDPVRNSWGWFHSTKWRFMAPHPLHLSAYLHTPHAHTLPSALRKPHPRGARTWS